MSITKKKKDDFISWKISKKILNTEDYKLNNRIAKKYSKENINKLAKKYTHIKPEHINFLLKTNKKIWKNIKGSGADLGGGVGLLSSVIAKKKEIKKIYCVEVVKNAVTKCQPIVKKKLLNKKAKKVISVLGSFDHIELKKSSLDFCIAWDAMHHSENLVKTLIGIKKVLKKNGKLIIVDRAHNNSTSDAEIQRMLNIVYSKEFLKENHLPINKKLTRRMNGEREYRYSDWEKSFKKSALKIEEVIILKEKHEKVLYKKNDNKINEKIVNFSIGGFERKKIIYMLKK